MVFNLAKVLMLQMRVHHWLKNTLLALPLMASHKFTELELWLNVLLGFVAYSLAASSVYIVNDIADINEDRLHPTKKLRPLPSGGLSLASAYNLLFVVLVCLLLLLYLLSSSSFTVLVFCYLALNLVYSFSLKKKLGVDVVCLALMYTMRVLAGGYVASINVSFWFLSFSSFFFLSLAVLKRCAEMQKANDGVRSHSRAYNKGDLPILYNVGISSSLISGLVFLLYVHSPAVTTLYSNPQFLWMLLPLLFYWFLRLWLIAQRGLVDQDPIIFVIKDRVTWCLACIGLGLMYLAV